MSWLLSWFILHHGLHHILGSLGESEWPHGSSSVDSRGQGVDLTDGEPGQGGEDEVEEVLTNTNHDVLVLEDTSLDNLPEHDDNDDSDDDVKNNSYLSQSHQVPETSLVNQLSPRAATSVSWQMTLEMMKKRLRMMRMVFMMMMMFVVESGKNCDDVIEPEGLYRDPLPGDSIFISQLYLL